MRVKDVIRIMNQIAPPELACAWDQSIGLQIGNPEASVKKVLLTLDVSETAIKKAINEKADLIISHHALFFVSPDNINPALPLGKKIKDLLKYDVGVFVAHTNLDAAPEGVNYWLAKKEGLSPENCEIIEPTYTEELVKLAVFTPKTHVDQVRDAIALAGAGHIGNYSHCSYNIEGIGTFKPLKGAVPFIGKENKLETVEEVRIETILPKRILSQVLEAMFKVHPYEEVAYDVYPLLNQGKQYGLGLIGNLKSSKVIKGKKIKRLAVCSGGGGKLIEKAFQKGAQAIIMGECSYHDELSAKDLGILLIKKGHYATEQVVIKPLAAMLKKYLPKIKIINN